MEGKVRRENYSSTSQSVFVRIPQHCVKWSAGIRREPLLAELALRTIFANICIVYVETQDLDLFFNETVDWYVGNRRFLRRDWLARELEVRLSLDDCRFVLLIAEPGAGKSAFMAQIAEGHPDWLRYFIRRDQHRPLADV